MDSTTPRRAAHGQSQLPFSSPQLPDGSPGQLDALLALMGSEPTDGEAAAAPAPTPLAWGAADGGLASTPQPRSAAASTPEPAGHDREVSGAQIGLADAEAPPSPPPPPPQQQQHQQQPTAAGDPPTAAQTPSDATAAAAASDAVVSMCADQDTGGSEAVPQNKVLEALAELCEQRDLDFAAVPRGVRDCLAGLPDSLIMTPGKAAGEAWSSQTLVTGNWWWRGGRRYACLRLPAGSAVQCIAVQCIRLVETDSPCVQGPAARAWT